MFSHRVYLVVSLLSQYFTVLCVRTIFTVTCDKIYGGLEFALHISSFRVGCYCFATWRMFVWLCATLLSLSCNCRNSIEPVKDCRCVKVVLHLTCESVCADLWEQDRHIRVYNVEKGWTVQKDIQARNLRWTVTDTALSPDQRFLVRNQSLWSIGFIKLNYFLRSMEITKRR